MHLFARILLCLIILDAGFAVYSEYSGVGIAVPPTTYAAEIVRRDESPRDFENLMTYQWTSAAVFFVVWLLLLALIRRQNRLDPFDKNFRGARAIDDLERSLARDEERRKRPLKP